MKIISKYRDYYDFLSGVYGTDTKIILDRRVFDKYEIFPSDDKIIDLHICDYIFEGFIRDNKIYWGENLLEIAEEPISKPWDFNKEESAWIKYRDTRFSHYGGNGVARKFFPYKDKKLTNTVNKCSILIRQYSDSFYRFPKLSELNIKTVLSPKDIYLMLSEWLAPNDNTTDTRSNTEKIVSAGFDLKTSFRH